MRPFARPAPPPGEQPACDTAEAWLYSVMVQVSSAKGTETMSEHTISADRDAGAVPLRGSREATLGAGGLRVSPASGTTPVRAPDVSRAPVYGGYHRDHDAEPRYASREAALGGSSPAARAAGGLPSVGEQLPRGARPGDPDPERDWARDEGVGNG